MCVYINKWLSSHWRGWEPSSCSTDEAGVESLEDSWRDIDLQSMLEVWRRETGASHNSSKHVPPKGSEANMHSCFFFLDFFVSRPQLRHASDSENRSSCPNSSPMTTPRGVSLRCFQIPSRWQPRLIFICLGYRSSSIKFLSSKLQA